MQKLFERIEQRRDELVELTRQLVRIPTVNPPGDHYRDCAELLGDRLGSIHDAVQPGRRIATVRDSAGLGLPVALISDAAGLAFEPPGAG